MDLNTGTVKNEDVEVGINPGEDDEDILDTYLNTQTIYSL